MGVFNALVFDGINSLNYGVYITGEAVFNSPQRAVEAVTVPGRNGDVLLDLGRYENIEVTYHAGVFGVDQSEFATKIRTFRNLLASRVGYKRITDTYNPNEYRMGTFIASVDVTPTSMDRHGEFDIVFNCKPQRFLTSGETAITVTDGGTVTNPTLFESQPLLAIKGYGTVGFNGYEVEIENAVVGDVIISSSKRYSDIVSSFISIDDTYSYDLGLFESSDTITISGLRMYAQYKGINGFTVYDAGMSYDSSSLQDATLNPSTANNIISFEMVLPTISFTVGTSATKTYYVNCSYKNEKNGAIGGGSFVIYLYIYSYSDGRVRLYGLIGLGNGYAQSTTARYGEFTSIIGTSTKSILGDPTYIDCELGEAYMISDGDYVSLNEYIDLGSDLPTLAPGNNEFDIANTMTDVKLTPRWWIL